MKLITVCAALAVFIVAGCGGGGGLSKSALASKANAICKKYSEEGTKLGQPDLTDPDKAKDYFTKATALAGKQQADLEKLKPDAKIKTAYGKLTKATSDATQLLNDLAKAAAAKDQKKGVELVKKLTPLSAQVNSAAKAVGADACAG